MGSKVEPGGYQQDHHLSLWTESETISQLPSSWDQPINTPASLPKKRKSLNSDKKDNIINHTQKHLAPENSAEDIEIELDDHPEEPNSACIDNTKDLTEEDSLFFCWIFSEADLDL
jgi:hypothetical protein